MKKNKVFIISLHKTGTTSLAHFLGKMGYLVTGPDTQLFRPAINNDYYEVDKFLQQYDAFQDDPWYMLYPYLHTKYPNAKFIFLERSENEWIDSVQNFYGRDRYNNRIRKYFYGSADTILNKDLYLEKYRRHNIEVKKYFKNRNNFISISISNNEDVVKLQRFLGAPIKFTSFPHKNKAPKSKKEIIKKKTKKIIQGGFGFKNLIKNSLANSLGHEKFIRLRTIIRLAKAKTRVFFNKKF